MACVIHVFSALSAHRLICLHYYSLSVSGRACPFHYWSLGRIHRRFSCFLVFYTYLCIQLILNRRHSYSAIIQSLPLVIFVVRFPHIHRPYRYEQYTQQIISHEITMIHFFRFGLLSVLRAVWRQSRIAITRLPVLAVDAGPSAPHGMHQSVRASAQRPSTAPPPTVDLQRPMGRELLTRVCHAHLCNSEFVTSRTHRDRRASCITLMRT